MMSLQRQSDEIVPGFYNAAKRSRRQYLADRCDNEDAENSIIDQLEWEDTHTGTRCRQCRNNYTSTAALHHHHGNECWVTMSEEDFPKEWTPALWAYVRRAVHPENREPDWSLTRIINALEWMIAANHTVRARWETMYLPQDIQPPVPKISLQVTPVASRPVAPKVYADIFDTGNSSDPTPKGLFKHKAGRPFVARRDKGEMLVFTDGACPNNGQDSARGGCSFVVRCSKNIPWPWVIPQGAYFMHGAFFFRLEEVGPSNQPERPTSNRAELRAVVASLRCIGTGRQHVQFSKPKDQSKLVVATDSVLVAKGATTWSKVWEVNGWKSSDGNTVKNRDLWEELLARVRELLTEHCAKVSFWHIPRELNQEADRLAKLAATFKARSRFGVPSAPVALVELDGP